jgi:hypothetical protein
MAWLQGLPISMWAAQSDYGYPILLSIHSIGMAAVVGILLIFSFRVLGYATAVPLQAIERLMPIAWLGFLLNLGSGAILFMADATRMAVNWPFYLMILCVVVGGWLSWALWRTLRRNGFVSSEPGRPAPAAEPTITPTAKILALVSIPVWLGAIAFGRLIATVISAAYEKVS